MAARKRRKTVQYAGRWRRRFRDTKLQRVLDIVRECFVDHDHLALFEQRLLDELRRRAQHISRIDAKTLHGAHARSFTLSWLARYPWLIPTRG
eukprot:m.192918 g.192918  ORF g.192918 m.192918 type:complete len:93 (+) comp10063_c0_seq3:960-1238(+)